MSIRRYVKDVKESISLVLQVINYWLNFLTRIANVKHQNRSITASFLYYLSHFLLNNALAISLWMLLSLYEMLSLYESYLSMNAFISSTFSFLINLSQFHCLAPFYQLLDSNFKCQITISITAFVFPFLNHFLNKPTSAYFCVLFNHNFTENIQTSARFELGASD